jgi:hypothetical protein
LGYKRDTQDYATMEEDMEDINIQKVRKDYYLLTVNKPCDVVGHKTNGCCILRGPIGERILDVVPGGTELETLGIRRGVLAGHTHKHSQ